MTDDPKTRTITLSEVDALVIEEWGAEPNALLRRVKEAVIAARPAPVVVVGGATWTRTERGWRTDDDPDDDYHLDDALDRIYELEKGDQP